MFTKIRKKALGIHPLLLYYHDLRKTFAAMMQNARIRGIPHLPSPLLRAPAIIHFFEPDKKSLIEHTNGIEHRMTNKKRGAHDLIDLLRFCVIEIARKVLTRHAERKKKRIKRARKPSHARLQRAVAIQELRPKNAATVMRLHKLHHMQKREIWLVARRRCVGVPPPGGTRRVICVRASRTARGLPRPRPGERMRATCHIHPRPYPTDPSI